MEKINIILNGLDPMSMKFKVNEQVIKLKKQFPDMFYSNMEIWGIFGNFSVAKHAAHDVATNRHRTHFLDMQRVKDLARQNGVHIILDAGSSMIRPNSVYDYYDNCIYDLFNDKENFVSTDNIMIKKLLAREYPAFQVLPSYYSGMTQEEIFDMINDGKLAFMQPEFDYEALMECDTNFAIMVINPWCKLWCSKYFAHLKADQETLYNFHNEMELRVPTEQLPNKWVGCNYCPNHNNSVNAKTADEKFLTVDKMNKLANNGIRFFMFENFIFESFYNIVETYCKTLVVPEAADKFRFLILQAIESKGGIR